MCLEEMLELTITAGDLFYGTRQRRTEVKFDSSLRDTTESVADQLHQMIRDRQTPTAQRQRKCDKCSLIELCLPDSQRLARGTKAWNDRQIKLAASAEPPETDSFDIGLAAQ
jgi:CRISPR-associated exonuclease Cas4